MKRQMICCAAAIVALYLCALPSFAQHGHGGGGGGGVGHGAIAAHGHESSEVREGNRTSMGGAKTADEQLAKNSKLSSKLQVMLPPNTNLQDAAKGFKNLGQFVAAVHVSHNLGISFDQLKAMMTGSHHDSLGAAIRALKPDADAKSEAKKAKQEADDDLRETNS